MLRLTLSQLSLFFTDSFPVIGSCVLLISSSTTCDFAVSLRLPKITHSSACLPYCAHTPQHIHTPTCIKVILFHTVKKTFAAGINRKSDKKLEMSLFFSVYGSYLTCLTNFRYYLLRAGSSNTCEYSIFVFSNYSSPLPAWISSVIGITWLQTTYSMFIDTPLQ